MQGLFVYYVRLKLSVNDQSYVTGTVLRSCRDTFSDTYCSLSSDKNSFIEGITLVWNDK